MRVLGQLAALLAPPDDALLEAAAGGERLIAAIRLVFFATLSLVPIIILAAWPDSPTEVWIGLVAAVLGLLVSLVIARMVRRGQDIPGLPFLTSAFDVTLVTATLASFAVAGRPLIAVNSMVVWEIYMLHILATCLRFDLRLCFATGALAVAEYAALLAWIVTRWDLPRGDLAFGQNVFNWPIQAGRLILLVAATALAAGMVLRTKRLMHVSGTDRLTGLANRAYFEERLAAEVARAGRTGRPLTLAFLDLDRFKTVNDSFGHATGDLALRHVARLLVEESRKEDVIARWGGEEFVLVLPDTDLAGGHEQAERVRRRVAASPMATRQGLVLLALSAGCAAFPAEGGDAAGLLAAADRRLLAAKRGGRNRVVSADEAPPPGPPP
ncbi:MAG TPA: GGDEF domain-containing protein [Vicinamibacteria bacterium]